MKTEAEAVELAQTMVQIGQLAGRETVALVTDMNQPLGRAIGNALEVKEAILTLQGKGPQRLTELCLTLAVEMLLLAGAAQASEEARELVERSLQDGHALRKFEELVVAQGGDADVVRDLTLLPQAAYTRDVLAPSTGFVKVVDPLAIGVMAMELGAGRENKDSIIDLAVGIELQVEVGDHVGQGEVLAKLYANDPTKLGEVMMQALQAFELTETKPEPLPTIYRRITAKEL